MDMYQDHFHLKASPFNLGPDPKFLYLTDTLREALSVLAYGVTARKGFVQLTGEVGTGKTTLLNMFLQSLQAKGAATAFVFNPHLEPDEVLDFVMADFGIEPVSISKSRTMLQFNRWLLDLYSSDRLAVLFVDEAQQLSAAVLEELRLLTNLETPTHKLLQIVLCGQPELDALLDRPSLSQLRQRITLRCRTARLSADQTIEYIAQRLRVADAKGNRIFEPDAISLIHRFSGGIPRLINSICEQSMIESFCDGAEKVKPEVIEKVAREIGLTAHVSVVPEIRTVRIPAFEEEKVAGMGKNLFARERNS